MHTLKEKKMAALKRALELNKEQVKAHTIHFVSLPTESAHSGHLTGRELAGFGQRVNSNVAAKISEFVAGGITEIHDIRKLLKHYVKHELCKDSPPDLNDRAYFPMDVNLKNHISMAKRGLQLSCLDQENLHLKNGRVEPF